MIETSAGPFSFSVKVIWFSAYSDLGIYDPFRDRIFSDRIGVGNVEFIFV